MYTLSILNCIIALLVSTALPIGFILVYGLKNKRQGLASAWILGALGFIVTQLCIRLPILQAIGQNPGFQSWALTHWILYTFALAFTAGLFEFASRYAVAKILNRKGLTYRKSLAAGLGHGGIEAILIVGMTMVNNLVLLVMIQTGGFDALVAQTAAAGADTAPLLAAQATLTAASPWIFLLGAYERLLTMVGHLAMSMLVCWGIHTKRPLKACLWCLGIHTGLDFSTVFSVMATPEVGLLSQTTAYWIIYSILTAVAVLCFIIIRNLHQRWNAEQEAAYVEK